MDLSRVVALGVLQLIGKSESADEHGLRRIRKIVHVGHARGPVGVVAARDVGDTASAFPLVLVGASELAELDEHRGLFRYRHVPHLLTRIAEGAQQVGLFLIGPGQLAARADARHLRAARLAPGHLAALFARNVKEQFRRPRVGHIQDRGAVLLHSRGERIDHASAVRPDVGDPAVALPLDGRLVGGAGGQIVEADPAHVVRFFAAGIRLRGGDRSPERRGGGNSEKRGSRRANAHCHRLLPALEGRALVRIGGESLHRAKRLVPLRPLELRQAGQEKYAYLRFSVVCAVLTSKAVSGN